MATWSLPTGLAGFDSNLFIDPPQFPMFDPRTLFQWRTEKICIAVRLIKTEDSWWKTHRLPILISVIGNFNPDYWICTTESLHA